MTSKKSSDVVAPLRQFAAGGSLAPLLSPLTRTRKLALLKSPGTQLWPAHRVVGPPAVRNGDGGSLLVRLTNRSDDQLVPLSQDSDTPSRQPAESDDFASIRISIPSTVSAPGTFRPKSR